MTSIRPLALDLMETYARDTGITGEDRPRRYLWTDAFGVCTLLGLARETGRRPDPARVEDAVVRAFGDVFGRRPLQADAGIGGAAAP